MSDLIEKAKAIATEAHKTQVRKTDGSPYIRHPETVANMLAELDFEDTVVAAAWVHDVLEDTAVSEDKLREVLGDDVVTIVTAVSEDTNLEWELRKEKYTDAVASASEATKAVSIADKIHNAESLIEYHQAVGPEAWSVFNRGKAKKLWFEELLYKKVAATWQHPLVDRYRTLIDKMTSLKD